MDTNCATNDCNLIYICKILIKIVKENNFEQYDWSNNIKGIYYGRKSQNFDILVT